MTSPMRSQARTQVQHRMTLGELDDKEPGRHRWIVISTHTVTPSQVAAIRGGAVVKLAAGNRLGLVVGCVDCEVLYDDCHHDPCAAGDIEAAASNDNDEEPRHE